MNCEQLQTIVGAEPNSTNPEVLAHIEQCPACARYREEMQAMDRLIYRALAVEAPAEKSAAQLLAPPRPPSARVWRMAASVLVTVLVGSMALWLLSPRESFAEEAITHMRHEQASMVRTSESVDGAELEQILAAARLRLKPGAAHVSYARSCPFRGQQIPHLVVQTEQGPATVLVVTDAPTQKRERINEDGIRGVILPAPRGVIVVLGENSPVDAVAKTVLGALEY
jgi:anti-sigma factor RsiW